MASISSNNSSSNSSSSNINDNENPFYKLPTPHYRFDEDKKVIIHRQSANTISGLMRILKSKFYPHYNYDDATRYPVKPSKVTKSKYAPQVKYHKTLRWAKARGCKVDNQLSEVVEKLKDNQRMTLDDLIQRAEAKNEFNQYTIDIMKALRKEKLHPLESQYCVGIGNVIGTMIDLICQDLKKGELVAIEIKTGNPDKDLWHTGHRLESPFKKYSDCLASQYQLQLAAGIGFYNASMCKSGQHKRITKGYVIKAHSPNKRIRGKVTMTILRDAFLHNANKIVEILCA